MHQRQLVVNVEVVGRLVKQQDARLLRQRAGNVRALALTARQGAPVLLALLLHADQRQRFGDNLIITLRPGLQGAQPGGAPQLDGILHRDRIDRVGHLRNQRQPARDHAPGNSMHRLAFEKDLARTRRIDAGQQTQEAGFARTVGADQPQHFPGVQAQTHVLHQPCAAHAPADIARFQHDRPCAQRFGRFHLLLRHDRRPLLFRRITANTGAPTRAVMTPIGSTWPMMRIREATSDAIRKIAPSTILAGMST